VKEAEELRTIVDINFADFFRKVCRKSKIFLDSIVIEPIVDVKTFNSALFEFAPALVS
jgi:hypothetical protein